MKILALIPARGGSKGLPRKNVLPLDGHPLIAYSIAAALSSPRIDRVVVTTDSEEIAEIARKYGAETPFIRPKDLAGDFTTDLETFQHALNWLEENEGYKPDAVFQFRPTTPIRFQSEIEKVIDLLNTHSEADSVRSIALAPVTPYKMWVMDGPETPLNPLLSLPGVEEPFNMPRQKLPPVYWHTGTYDLIRTQVIRSQNSMTGKVILPLVQDEKMAVDIDHLVEFQRATEVIKSTECIRPKTARKPIKLFITDVDGVLTDAGMYYSEGGEELKKFNTHDGMGLKMIREAGIKTGIITTENTRMVERRALKLKVDYLRQNAYPKVEAAMEMCQALGIGIDEVAYIGDDINCLELLSIVGLAACPADALAKVKAIPGIIHLTKKGGEGVVREFIELIFEKYL